MGKFFINFFSLLASSPLYKFYANGDSIIKQLLCTIYYETSCHDAFSRHAWGGSWRKKSKSSKMIKNRCYVNFFKGSQGGGCHGVVKF